jgi:hypothetical protein
MLGAAIGVVTIASGLREAYKGVGAYTRARGLEKTISSETAYKLTTTATGTDKAECTALLKDMQFGVDNNYTRAGDKAKLAAIELTSGTIAMTLTALTSGMSLGASVGLFAATEGSKKLVTGYRARQETPQLATQREATSDRLTKKLGEIQAKIKTNAPLSQSDKLMMEGLKAVGLLSKQTDVHGDLSKQSARGTIMTTLRGKQTVSEQLANIKPHKLVHAFTKGADGIKEAPEAVKTDRHSTSVSQLKTEASAI